jgi:hypothetical protein
MAFLNSATAPSRSPWSCRAMPRWVWAGAALGSRSIAFLYWAMAPSRSPLSRRALPRLVWARAYLGSRSVAFLYAAGVAALGPVAADEVGQAAGQDLPQPGGQLSVGAPAELVEAQRGLEQGVLHQVGGVGLPPQRGVQAGAGQEAQVVAVRVQQPVQGAGLGAAGPLDQPAEVGAAGGHGCVRGAGVGATGPYYNRRDPRLIMDAENHRRKELARALSGFRSAGL